MPSVDQWVGCSAYLQSGISRIRGLPYLQRMRSFGQGLISEQGRQTEHDSAESFRQTQYEVC